MEDKIGCLIVHGFGGSVWEIQPLSDYLSSKGIVTVCPKLKGHTGVRRDLAHVNYEDWIQSAQEGLDELKSKCSFIVLVGFSMGGLICVNLALKNHVDSIVTLNTPIYYWDFKRIALNLKQDFKRRDYKYLKFYVRTSVEKPLYSLINFRKLLYITKPLFKEINNPMLIIQALEDDTVQRRSADYIYKTISSVHKELKYFTGSDHIICRSSVCSKVFNTAYEFLNKIYEMKNRSVL
ncbi:thermostable monoacylglycerol lipase [Oxobacter pfennigii]|uniref:Thermostable monoacylglycerol lipase n=1 Tax=Oxobacter pfennigii TaxID=36849 RepID=A0A0P8X3U4_9CLOT|nr:alpha/beta fold hydrolase [Oxobacter pfennigii]KPU45471.1 thermostable monoacylglycerol lipase [Oxobacter pfennigii]